MGNKHIRGEVSVKMKDVTAFKTASQVIADEMQEKGTMSYERAAEILNMYENAFTVVKRHFPLAQCGTDILLRADLLLMEHGCTGENTLYAQSICPDEINHESGDITELFSKHMGEVFHMGGLGGIPFTGKTGFAAFSHHVPDDGNLFILFAPHIGISDSGENIHFDATFAERGKPNLYLLGGIQINMPKPMPDFFMPLMFEKRNANGTVTDLMESTFGTVLRSRVGTPVPPEMTETDSSV
eukprot:gene13319-15341_t